MNNILQKYVNAQRKLQPDDSLISELEQEVMESIDRKPKQKVLFLVAAALTMIFSGIILSNIYNRTVVEVEQVPSSLRIESIIFLEDHTSIWLEPLDTQVMSGRSS